MSSRISKFGLYLAAAILTGASAGTASAVFLRALDLATEARDLHPWLTLTLPLGGSIVGWLYHAFGRDLGDGSALILDQIREPRSSVPTRLVPLVLGGTVLTHLGGGSAGREGTAVQMGGALADRIGRLLRVTDRRRVLRAGVSAGFGSVFGVPWAGAVFGLEIRRAPHSGAAALGCLVASFVGHHVALFWGVRHVGYAAAAPIKNSALAWVLIPTAGVLFGLCARVFTAATRTIRAFCARVIPYAPLAPVGGGLLVLAGYRWLGSLRYAGLGISVIEEALVDPVSFGDFARKLWFTALTLGSGFKGGEVTPLLFIGTTLGSALSGAWSFGGLAHLGFVAVFAGAAGTPLAGAVMAGELFGWAALPPALVACGISAVFAGRRR